jgi:ubiquinone/menaquinone biosynthesis C-methylase UbiE
VDPERYAEERPANRLALEERGRVLIECLRARGADLGNLEILEVGCGTGRELRWLVSLGADEHRLHGLDLRPDAIRQAQVAVPNADLRTANATSLPYPDGAFDLVYQSTALSSMTSARMRQAVAQEVRRVVRPGGLVASYDFAWNPLNRDTVGIGRRELTRLFPGWPSEFHRVTLIPPVGRWAETRSQRLLQALASISVLKSHLLAVVDVPPS